MDGAIENFEELHAQGLGFNYANFATKSEYGFAKHLSAQWIAWSNRVSVIVKQLFDKDSAPYKLVTMAEALRLTGNGEDRFSAVHSYYIDALRLGIESMKQDIYGEIVDSSVKAVAPKAQSNKVFIVHGHDDKSKQDLEILLREFGLDPIVLHRKADGGRTLIEKFEQYSDVGYAFVIMTPDEIAYLSKDADLEDANRRKEYRARPNVIFEFGFFVGRLGRSRTCCILKGDVAVPSDLNGLVYKKFNISVEEIAYALQKELKEAGYKLL
ncbi:TIR domain-containing protein [Methylobacterium komagatae]